MENVMFIILGVTKHIFKENNNYKYKLQICYKYALLILIETSHNTLLTINEFEGSHTQYLGREVHHRIT